jgi:type IV pilus assembly protein PilX
MSETVSRRRVSTRPVRQQGFVLITGMLFLVVMTMLGLALFRSTGLMDRISANTRDKQRSFEAAEAALQYGAWWLSTAGGGSSVSCAANVNQTVANLHVCTEALSSSIATVAALGWTATAYAYTPPGMIVAAGGGLASGGTDINYQKPPGVYIENIGLAPTGSAQFFQLTAYGYGGDINTVSVVRSTYKQTAKSKSLTTP